MKTFNEILPNFLATKSIALKRTTYLSHVSTSKVFSEWLDSRGLSETPLAEINAEIIELFSVYLAEEKKLDRTTCRKYSVNLKQIFKYVMERGHIDKIPFDLFVLPKKGKDCSAQVITQEHSKILLEDIRKHDRQLYLAYLTEYYTFLRPGRELRLLKVENIDFKNGTITVPQELAKNGKKRVVTMPNQLIEEYKHQGVDKATKCLYVFGHKKRPGKVPCSVNMLGYRFRKYRDRNKLPKGYTLYSGKCSGATKLHESNVVSMRSIMDQLGHSNLTSTQHYLKRYAGAVNLGVKADFPSPY